MTEGFAAAMAATPEATAKARPKGASDATAQPEVAPNGAPGAAPQGNARPAARADAPSAAALGPSGDPAAAARQSVAAPSLAPVPVLAASPTPAPASGDQRGGGHASAPPVIAWLADTDAPRHAIGGPPPGWTVEEATVAQLRADNGVVADFCAMDGRLVELIIAARGTPPCRPCANASMFANCLAYTERIFLGETAKGEIGVVMSLR